MRFILHAECSRKHRARPDRLGPELGEATNGAPATVIILLTLMFNCGVGTACAQSCCLAGKQKDDEIEGVGYRIT